MVGPMNDVDAAKLRAHVAALTAAAEARIRGEQGAEEKIRRTTQDLRVAGMGEGEFWVSLLYQPFMNVCLIMAQEIGLIPEINKTDGPVTAVELSKALPASSLLIARIMRVLTSVGICNEVSNETYQANSMSHIAGSLGGQAAIKKVNELFYVVGAQVQPYMRQYGIENFPPPSLASGSGNPDVCEFAFGGKSMWEYLKTNEEMKYWFDTLMGESRRGDKSWFTIYPFHNEVGATCSKDANDVLLVDIGGNRGADILDCRKAYPELGGRFILQDLPETIAAVDPSNLPGIEAHAYDIFTPQPIKGAKAYFLKRVLHDFDDDAVRKFLPNVVAAMGADSKLLIQELVLPDTGASVKGSHLDILMMLYHSGMERSLSQWRKLLAECGVELVKFWSRPDTDPCVLECRKAV